MYRTSNAFDYGVQTLESRPASGRGFFDEGRTRAFSERTESEGRFQTTVVVRRYGEGLFPVDVLVTFEDGETVRERWDGRDRWKLYEYDRPSRAVSVQVDPDRVLLLDLDYTNNSYTLAPRADEAARKWSLVWLAWLQDALLTYALFI